MFKKEAKVIILGDSGVGKSSTLYRLIDNKFLDDTESTIGAAFIRWIPSKNERDPALHIWDTAGQERFRSIAPLYIRGTDVVIFVFDLTEPQSFENIIHVWIPKVKKFIGDKETLYYIFANKCDLNNEKTVYYNKRIKEMIDSIKFYQTSAFSGLNIRNAFDDIYKCFYKEKKNNYHYQPNYDDDLINKSLEEANNNGRKCC